MCNISCKTWTFWNEGKKWSQMALVAKLTIQWVSPDYVHFLTMMLWDLGKKYSPMHGGSTGGQGSFQETYNKSLKLIKVKQDEISFKSFHHLTYSIKAYFRLNMGGFRFISGTDWQVWLLLSEMLLFLIPTTSPTSDHPPGLLRSGRCGPGHGDEAVCGLESRFHQSLVLIGQESNKHTQYICIHSSVKLVLYLNCIVQLDSLDSFVPV